MIDTNGWKEFRIDSVFNVRGGFFNKKPEHGIAGTVPFLAATDSNNGVTEYYSWDDVRSWNKVGEPDNSLEKKVFKAPAIVVTVNGACGKAFFQDTDYTCSHDITSLTPKDGHVLTANEGLFCCTAIECERYRWSYGRKPHDIKKFSALIIKLPADDNGNPDWAFMHSYMDGLGVKPLTTKIKSSQMSFDVSSWKEFRLGDWFDIRKGKRLTAEDQEPGTIPYIGAIDSNNGVSNYIAQQPIHDRNTISLSYNGSVGEAFYQPEPYWATDDVNALYLKPCAKHEMNVLVGLFMAAILRQERYRFSYGRKWTLNNMKNAIIKLPADAKGNPDWEWMEQYIKSLPYGDRL